MRKNPPPVDRSAMCGPQPCFHSGKPGSPEGAFFRTSPAPSGLGTDREGEVRAMPAQPGKRRSTASMKVERPRDEETHQGLENQPVPRPLAPR